MSLLTTPPVQDATGRFTLDGGDQLERYLSDLCRRICRAVLKLVPASMLEGLVLAGGYGRGQGGVLKTRLGEAPYNDLEFYAFLRGNHFLNSAKYNRSFQTLEEALSSEGGLHVEFKIDSLAKLRRSSVSIFSYDLVSGHRIVFGSDAIFQGCEKHLEANRIPAAEATRLLLNRCSGLLLAKELLLKDFLTEQEGDFVGRNIAKAKLALGDALLALTGQYHWDCLERSRRLHAFAPGATPAFFSGVLKHHDFGVRFKLHPIITSGPIEELRRVHQDVTGLALEQWLWIENQRLSTSFSNLREYAFSRVNKCAGRGLWRDFLLNIRACGARAAFDGLPRYPRERLLNALPLLLSEAEAGAAPETRKYLQAQLHARAQDWHSLLAAYRQIWSAYG